MGDGGCRQEGGNKGIRENKNRRREERAEEEGFARGKEKYKFVTFSTDEFERNSNISRHGIHYISMKCCLYYVLLYVLFLYLFMDNIQLNKYFLFLLYRYNLVSYSYLFIFVWSFFIVLKKMLLYYFCFFVCV